MALTDIATLGIAVESRDVPRATNELDQLTEAGARTEVQTKKVETASQRMNREIAEAKRQFQGLKQTLAPLISLMATLGVALGIRELVRAVDLYKEMTNRLRLVTGSVAQLTGAQDALFKIAQATRVVWDGTVDLYARLARSTRTLGTDNETLLKVTRAVNQTISISGTSATEAAGALRQLGQGLASGTLRGDELNSVLENIPRLAEAIAVGMGKSLGELRSLGAAGKITAEAIIEALVSQATIIRQEFEKMVPTISQAFTVLGNATLKTIGELDVMTGASAAVASSIVMLAENFRLVEAGAAAAGTAVSLLALRYIPALIAAVNALTVAMATNPLTLPLVAISATVAALVYYRDELVKVGNTTARVRDFVGGAFDLAADTVTTAVDKILAGVEEVEARIDGLFGQGAAAKATGFVKDIITAWLLLPSRLLNVVYGTAKTITDTFVIAFEEVYRSGKTFVEQLAELFEKLGEAMQKGLAFDLPGAARAVGEARGMSLGFGETNIADRVAKQAIANFQTDWVAELVDTIAGAGEDVLAEIERRAAQRKRERSLDVYGADQHSIMSDMHRQGTAAPREEKLSQDTQDRIAELKREREELERLVAARSKGIGAYDAAKRAIDAENEAIKLGLEPKQKAYQLVVQLAQGNLELQRTLDVNTRVADLQREQEELKRLLEARKLGEKSYDATAAVIDAENEARKLGLSPLSEEYNLVVALAAANGRLKEAIDEVADAEKNHKAAVEEIRGQLSSLFPTYEHLKAEADAWREEQLANLDATKTGYAEFATDVDRVYTQMLRDARRKDLDNSKYWLDGVTRSWEDYVKTASDGAAAWESATTSALSSMEDAFAQWASTGKLEAKNLVNSILADLARLAFRQAIIAPIAGFLGTIIGGASGGVGAGAAAGAVQIAHAGGIAGMRSSARNVPYEAFRTAQRHHSGGLPGFGPDEVPIIARRGEEVLTRRDPRHRFNGGGMGASITNYVTVTVDGNGKGGQSDNRQMGQEVAELVSRALDARMAEWVREQMRPGNMLNPNGARSYGF